MRWSFRSRGTAPAQAGGPGEQAVRPSGQWRELPAATSVLRPQPTANSRGFVRTLPSRWQQPAVLAPLGHDVTADAPGGSVTGLAVGVDLPATGFPRPPATRPPSWPRNGRSLGWSGSLAGCLARRSRGGCGQRRHQQIRAPGRQPRTAGPAYRPAWPCRSGRPHLMRPCRRTLAPVRQRSPDRRDRSPRRRQRSPDRRDHSPGRKQRARPSPGKHRRPRRLPSTRRCPAAHHLCRPSRPGLARKHRKRTTTAPHRPSRPVTCPRRPGRNHLSWRPPEDHSPLITAGHSRLEALSAAQSVASTSAGQESRTQPWPPTYSSAREDSDARAFPAGPVRVARVPEAGERPATPVVFRCYVFRCCAGRVGHRDRAR